LYGCEEDENEYNNEEDDSESEGMEEGDDMKAYKRQES
jgi:hypothetical protein